MASKTILIGHLGSDPEKRIIPGNGKAVVNVSLATTETWKDKNGQKQSETEWHRLVIYSPLAEVVESYTRKGSKLFVIGRNKTRKWQNRDGVDMYTTEVIVRELELLDSKHQSTGQSQQYNSHQVPPQNQDDILEDDIPF